MASSCFNPTNSLALPLAIRSSSPVLYYRPCIAVSATAISSNNEGKDAGDSRGFPSSVHIKKTGNPLEILQLDQAGEKAKAKNSSDVMKLFSDVQQNMLYLNKQRIAAIDDLQRVQRENETLIAKIKVLEANIEASEIERDVLQRELQTWVSKFGKGSGMQNMQRRQGFIAEAMPLFSELLLRIDSMVLTGAIDIGQASLLKNLALKQDARAADVFNSLRSMDDKTLASGILPLLDPNRSYGLHITHICTELDPIVKCTDLGKFVLNLSTALQRKGNLVEVILPKYSTLDVDIVEGLREIPIEFHSYYDGQWLKNKIWTGVVNGIAVTLIEPLHPAGFFQRDDLYGYNDDFERFSYFSRAAMDYIVKSGKQPDVLHLHNWQTALVAPMFWDLFVGQGLGATRILLTCNDFKDQCLQEPAKLSLCGLDPDQLHRADRLQDNNHPDLSNILKGGIVYSNKVTTLSPAYALDAMTPEHGHGLESTLVTHKNKFIGIYNGLDISVWDPSNDTYIPSTYSVEDLSGKVTCKTYLRKLLDIFGSESESTPLVGCLATQVSEEELELIEASIDCAMKKGCQFIFMGKSSTPNVQTTIERIQGNIQGREGRVRVLAEYDDSIAHLVIAASDILICVSTKGATTAEMPLTALQYGTIPVTRQDVSGQRVIDAGDGSQWKEGNAFIYSAATPHDLIQALTRAIDCKVNNPKKWKDLIHNGMSIDFSWDSGSVEEYMAAYASIKEL